MYTNLKDAVERVGEERHDLPGGYHMRSYRLKVEQFIRQHKHHLTIHKLYSNEPITAAELQELERLLFDGDERGTKEALMEELGDPQPLGVFIRQHHRPGCERRQGGLRRVAPSTPARPFHLHPQPAPCTPPPPNARCQCS